MSKVILWIVIIFAVLFILRMINVAKARRRRDEVRQKPKQVADAMVRCVRCGVFLPQVDAQTAPGGFICGDASCTKRH